MDMDDQTIKMDDHAEQNQTTKMDGDKTNKLPQIAMEMATALSRRDMKSLRKLVIKHPHLMFRRCIDLGGLSAFAYLLETIVKLHLETMKEWVNQQSHLLCLQEILRCPGAVNAIDSKCMSNGRTPLFWAVEHNHATLVFWLCNNE